MIEPTIHVCADAALDDLQKTLTDAANVLTALLELERRDTLAPQRLLGAADQSLKALSQWRARIGAADGSAAVAAPEVRASH